MKEIQIYTDGACSGNPGPGGYGAVMIYGDVEKELSGGFKKTTNNRMEILSVIKALELLKYPCKVTVYSDSKYVVDAMEKKWPQRWKKNNWKRDKKEMAKNIDLWERMLALSEKQQLTFKWVKGHAGHPLNERADQLAVLARENEAELEEDKGFLEA